MTAEEILSFSACASCKIYCVFGTCVIAGKTSRAVAAPLRLSVAYCYVSCGTDFGACAAGIATFACTETFIVSYEAAEELPEQISFGSWQQSFVNFNGFTSIVNLLGYM